MSLMSIEEASQEIFTLLDELTFTSNNKRRSRIRMFERELYFQLAVLRWASLISEHGKGEILKRIKEATPTGQNPPEKEMRAFAIASKYFIQAFRLSR